MSQDDSYEVRSYIPSQLDEFDAQVGLAVNTRKKAWVSNVLKFSRPPPCRRRSQHRTDVDTSWKTDYLPHVDRTLNHSKGDIDLDNVFHRQDSQLSTGNGLPSSTASKHVSDVGRRSLIGEALEVSHDNASTMLPWESVGMGNDMDVESKSSMPVST
jgi:hypothetical protein